MVGGLLQRIHRSSLVQGGIRNGQQSVEKEEAALQARPMEAQHAKVPSSGLRVAQVTFIWEHQHNNGNSIHDVDMLI